MALLALEGLTKRFGAETAVDGLDLAVEPGEMLVLLGPSGCGKSTLLRLIAGLEQPDAGRIRLNGQDITALPANKRPVNMMFQSYALFPHLSVADNIAFGLRREGLLGPEIARRSQEAMAMLEIAALGSRRPQQLSGGQQQRVALARALVKQPKLLLLDEPLAALDKRLRRQTQAELRRLNRATGIAFVFVTHDQDEAMALGDRVAVMRQGRIVQAGAPRALYDRPADRFVAGFLGEINLLQGPGGLTGIRPERIGILREAAAGALTGTVTDLSYSGDTTLVSVTLADGRALRVAELNAGSAPLGIGAAVWLRWPPEAEIPLAEA